MKLNPFGGFMNSALVLSTLFLNLLASPLWASSETSELHGICQKKKTASRCLMINTSTELITQVSWLLAGSHVDYVNDVLVFLRPGQSVMLSNPQGPDNCLFTDETTVTVTSKDRYSKDFYQQLQFDSQDNCRLIIR